MVMPWENVVPAAARPEVPVIAPERTVAVTGATGFIGGRLAERLVREHGVKVRCLVRNLAQAARLARLPVDIVPVDLTDQEGVRRALAGVDLVFHCAYDSVSRRQNLEGTRNLIAASGRGSGVRRLVHVSTFSVYEPFRDGDLTEDAPDGDRSWMYVRSKLDLEQEVLSAAGRGDCPATVIQPAIVYGPFGKSWTNAPAEMLLHGTVILPDGGQGLCNCVYVDDLIDALLLAAMREAAIGERFVISGPEPITWHGFFGHFARTLGAAPPIFWPAARITAAQRDVMRDLRMVLSDPKKIMQIIVRWGLARRILQAGLDAMPQAIYDLVVKYYFERGGPPARRQHIPDKQFLGLYTARPIVRSEKARRLLGYQPRFDIESGMAATMAYVGWAYGSARPRRVPPPTERDTPSISDAPRLADAS
jgi:nucleoside-diphosphate-sugar epimerase